MSNGSEAPDGLSDSTEDFTGQLAQMASGNQDAAADIWQIVYEELHDIARKLNRREASNSIVQTTVLVHEVYLKLVDQTRADWKGRAHFLAVAARAIRRILVDWARRENTQKRGAGTTHVEIEDALMTFERRPTDLLDLDEALSRLAEVDARASEVVALRFFAGLSIDETAEVLGLAPRTVDGDWQYARSWLHRRLRGAGEG